MVSAANERDRQRQPGPTPKNKDSKRLDLFGRKVYSSASLQLRVANHQALLGRYDFNVWQSVAKFADSLPEDSKQEFLFILDEGRNVARSSLQATSDLADLAARSIATAVDGGSTINSEPTF